MRAQAHTLEGVVAGLLLISALVFAYQVTAVTPLSGSTSSQHIENQQRATAEGALQTTAESGALRRAVLFWDASKKRFHGADNGQHYTNTNDPPNRFLDALTRTFDERGIALNVHVVYVDSSGTRRKQPMVYRGEPSDNAATATTMLTLYDDDVRYADPDGDDVAEPTGDELGDGATGFYVPDSGSGSSVYNVVTVEVTVWRQ
ncbi:DUF7288 family protein [Halorussus lipolyticus]|uniref:DUF7288 family protein n=1 Tax=Halorussus lipolyticus TaxID=3034024 RepID=UPI0023E79729|nr:hypothetical protein [Halorussus sp. DT80]